MHTWHSLAQFLINIVKLPSCLQDGSNAKARILTSSSRISVAQGWWMAVGGGAGAGVQSRHGEDAGRTLAGTDGNMVRCDEESLCSVDGHGP